MTRKQAKELLQVVTAWSEGLDIQVREKGALEWKVYAQDDPEACAGFSNSNWEWRVRPPSREFWIIRGIVSNRLYSTCRDKETALSAINLIDGEHHLEIIHCWETQATELKTPVIFSGIDTTPPGYYRDKTTGALVPDKNCE